MKRVITFILVAFTTICAHAAIITGTVRESSSNDAIAYATVSLLKPDSSLYSGAISDDNGNFKLQATSGTYILHVSYVGYNSLYRDVFLNREKLELGNIFLTEETIVMTEVEIKANKPLIQRQMDKIVMNVSSSPFAIGSSGADMLKKAPGVVIDKDGKVTVNGKSVAVYIDGRPSYMNNEQLKGLLQGTDATTIDKIEIITNPSAKYDAAGQGGIINIKLKKNKSIGVSGTLSGSYSGMYFKKSDKYYQGDHFSFSINHRGAKTYTSFALTQMYNNSGEYTSSISQQPYSGDTMRTISESRAEDVFQYYSARLTNDWYINDKHTLGFIINVPVMKFDMLSNPTDRYHSIIRWGNDTIQDIITRNHSQMLWPRYSGNLNYTFVINDSLNQELTVNTDYRRTGSKVDNPQENIVLVNNDAIVKRVPDYIGVKTNQDVDIFSAKADFQTAFWKTGMIECGAKYTMSHTANALTEDSVIASYRSTTEMAYDYMEHIGAVYISAAKQFNEHWNAKIGLRGELTSNKGIYQKETETKTVTKKPYFNLFPSAFVGYNPTDKWALSLNYTRRISRPDYWSLNPFVHYYDAHTYYCGNPDLKPMFTNQVAFNVGWSRYINLELEFSHTAGTITMRPEMLANGDLKYSYVNFGTTMSAGGSISLTEIPIVPKFKTDDKGKREIDGAWLALTANIGLYDNISVADPTNDAKYGTKHAFHSSYYGSLTAYLPKEWQIAVDAWGSTPYTSNYESWSGGYNIGVGIKKTWPEYGLTLSANVDDLVRSSIWSSHSIGMADGYFTSSKTIGDNQNISLGITWQFGKTQQHKYRNVGDYELDSRMGGGGGKGGR